MIGIWLLPHYPPWLPLFPCVLIPYWICWFGKVTCGTLVLSRWLQTLTCFIPTKSFFNKPRTLPHSESDYKILGSNFYRQTQAFFALTPVVFQPVQKDTNLILSSCEQSLGEQSIFKTSRICWIYWSIKPLLPKGRMLPEKDQQCT